MNRLFIVLVLVGAGVIGLAFYRGWFQIGSDKAGDKSNVTLSVDADKFQKDKKAAVASVEGLGESTKDKVVGPSESTMDGTVVSVSADKLTMTSKKGKELSHPLAAKVKLTCDGKTCTAADLKAGMKIRVTTNAAEPHAATRIEALDNNRTFETGA
jgi:hypothetical protein